ncbi:MAG: hypothetical protein ABFD92_02090 [Planctomycetaceae bacterium]|nr:hypothetical protein [Planctomycetaceae bacterium]
MKHVGTYYSGLDLCDGGNSGPNGCNPAQPPQAAHGRAALRLRWPLTDRGTVLAAALFAALACAVGAGIQHGRRQARQMTAAPIRPYLRPAPRRADVYPPLLDWSAQPVQGTSLRQGFGGQAQGTAATPATKPAAPRQQSSSATSATSAVSSSLIWRAVEYTHYRESRYGMDPRSGRGHVGQAGERGEFQLTPIWLDDYYRLFRVRLDPHAPTPVLQQAVANWYAARGRRFGDIDRLYELYRTGS